MSAHCLTRRLLVHREIACSVAAAQPPKKHRYRELGEAGDEEPGVLGRLLPEECLESLLPLTPVDQHLVRGGLESDGEAQEALEGGGGRAPAVEPEHELVEVGLEVPLAQAVAGPQRPAL